MPINPVNPINIKEFTLLSHHNHNHFNYVKRFISYLENKTLALFLQYY